MENDLDRVMAVPVTQPRCPVCTTTLVLEHAGDFDGWSCPGGHGVAATLSELYGTVQDDEIAQLWSLARQAAPGPVPSPLGGRAMARLTLAYDADELRWGDAGDASSSGHADGTIELDVDVENQLIWFDHGELETLPGDLADAQPTMEQLERVEQFAQAYGEEYLALLRSRQPGRLTELFADRLLARHPGAYRAADAAMRAITPM